MGSLDGLSAPFRAVGALARSSFLPHYHARSFGDIPLPLSSALRWPAPSFRSSSAMRRSDEESLLSKESGVRKGLPADIRVVVMDKDNCIAKPQTLNIWPPFKDKLQELRKAFPGPRLLIVSNSAGNSIMSRNAEQKAIELEKNTGIEVFRHGYPKPLCARSLLFHILNNPETTATHPSHIAVIGDSTFHDVGLAHDMGAWAISVGGITHSAARLSWTEKVMTWANILGFKPRYPERYDG